MIIDAQARGNLRLGCPTGGRDRQWRHIAHVQQMLKGDTGLAG
ncbi:hypothetical protein [Pseudomonas protegens]|nr:hypothetical protein [Pseudomonas protegens]MDS9879267.1 hypothetical protein [Pseudomonas protegens]